MRRAAILCAVLGLLFSAGCRAARAPADHAEPVATVVVPRGVATEAPSASEDTSRPNPPHVEDLSACVVELRDAKDVQAGAEERGEYEQALEAERAGNLRAARRKYVALIMKWPASHLIPLVYLAFAEIFRHEAERDPSRAEMAAAAYQKVLEYPPPDNVGYAYASLRLGDVVATSDGAQALLDYLRAIESVAKHPRLPCSSAVARRARAEVVKTYLEVGRPDRAYTFFERNTDAERAREMLSALVEGYRRAGKNKEACAAARAAPAGSDWEAVRQRACAK